jgi:hypothetical protein
MVGISSVGARGARSELEVAQAEAPHFEHVVWYKEPNMRKLYFYVAILSIASATTGYDGMMMNSSQNMNAWQTYFDNPTGTRLGVLNNAYNIGSIVAFFIVYVRCR